MHSIYKGKIQKPNVYGIRKRRLKQLNEEEDDEFPMEEEEWDLSSDTISAAEYLTGMKSSFGLCLSHQIYSILPNATTVDRELVSLRFFFFVIV